EQVEGVEATHGHLGGAVGVVVAAAARVGQDAVGLGDLLELLLGRGVLLVGVRVVLARQPAVGLLDLVLGGGALHAKDLVVVVGHPVSSRGRPAARTATGQPG